MSLDLEQWIYDQIVLFNKKQHRKDLGEEWTGALKKFNKLVEDINLLGENERYQLMQQYFGNIFGAQSHIKIEDRDFNSFFKTPSLDNFEQIIAMYPTDNDAKNLTCAVNDIRKLIPPKASEQ